MGFSDYTNTPNDDDDQNGPGGPGGPGGMLPPMPPMGGIPASQSDDVKAMLINYNERFKTANPTLFRDTLIAQTVSVLISKNKPNPLLVGPAGVGKTKIAEDIARRIEVGDPLIPSQLKGYTVYELPISNLIAGAGIVGQLEARMSALVDFATDKSEKVILFIDEIHLLQDDKDPIYKKVSQILKPALARGDMHLIGATTLQEARSFDNDPAFQRRFSRLIVDELNREQTLEILKGARASYVAHFKNAVQVSDDTLEALVTIADENSRADAHRPDSALTLLDRSMADTVVSHSIQVAQASATNNTMMVQALQSMLPIPLAENKVKSVALRLMTGLATKAEFNPEAIAEALSKLKGQEKVSGDLLETLRRDNLSVFPRKKPTAWLFTGPSGVGKTEAAKLIAEQLTGQPPIMLNMGEYHTAHDASKLIGAGPGYVGSESNKELPFDSLESNPYRVILLDELEKAHKTIHRLFLTALDEGWMRTASGKILDFSKTIIIATTNAAREAITKNPTGFSTVTTPKEITRQELTKALTETFDPEFLGRFTSLVAFAKIDVDIYTEIMVASYARERERIAISHPAMAVSLPVTLDPQVLEREVRNSFLPEQGARPAESTARRIIEDTLMEAAAAAATAKLAAANPIVVNTAQATPVPGDDEENVLEPA